MNKRHYEHTLPNIRGSLSNTYLELKNHDFGVVFTPVRGKAFSGTENGFVCHETHLAIFWRKSKIRPGRIGVCIRRQALPSTSTVTRLYPLRLVTPLQSKGDL